MNLDRRLASSIRLAAMGAAVNLVFFGALEAGLRLSGFEYSRFPRLMQQESVDGRVTWQNENRVLQHFVPDPRRMWKPEPGFGTVNRLGYQGRALPLRRDPNVRRILFLGDSCTNSGPEQYPGKVIRLLERSGVEAEALIAGVGGYSTYQGLIYLEELLAYRPDAIVAYFGWNDHWFAAAGVPDNEFRPLSQFQMLSYRAFSWLRTYQLVHYLIYPPRIPRGRLPFRQLIRLTRVPPEHFVDNLEAMIDLSRRAGIPILFVEPPFGSSVTNPSNAALFPPELIIRIHALYRELLRGTVSRHPGAAALVDVSPPEFDQSLIGRDGIHPNAAGYSRIAEAVSGVLVRFLRERGVRPAGALS